MEMPELPRRIYTLGEEPPAVHSISYHTCWTLHAALKKALHDDEYEELKESKLGVFIKFQELGFDWASRLVHYMLGFQLDIKKKYGLWSLVGPEPVRFSLLEFENLTGLNFEYIEDLERPHSVVTKELTSFWEMLGVHVEAGPSTQEIITSLERCEGWSRDDRTRLAYLAIFTGYIEGRKYSTPTRVSLARDISGCYTINGFAQALQVWVYTALPELGATFGNPLPNNPSRLILAYKVRKGHRQFKEVILSQEFDVEDTPAENIIKLMFVKKPWKWTVDCWEVTGTWVYTNPAVVSPANKKVVKEDNPRPRKKARKEASEEASEETAAVVSEEAAAVASEEAAAEASEEVHTIVVGLTKEDIKTMFKNMVDAMRGGFGTCLKEIKYLLERVEAVEKKVGITTKRKGTSAQNTTLPPKPTLEPESESVNGTNAGRKSLPEDKGPDVPADASSSKDKAPEPSLVLLDKNQSTVSDLQKEDARYLEKRDAALALCRAKSDRTRKLAASQQSPYTANSTAKEIIAAFERCEGWSRDDRKRLAYLAIFTGYIEGRKYSTPTRVSLARLVMELERFENYPWGRVAFKVLMDSVKGRDISGCYTINGFAQALQVWVYTALPELGANYGNPLPNNPSQPILAYKGRKGRRQFKDSILSQTRVINFVHKDIGEMLPKWEFDVEDTPAENIIKLMFVKKLWKWTMDC
ncbi:hypothetical protein F2Q69_00004586 [Brassica cretica]|uniref:DUF1985 domain-containing protein n=1 Tax=Brassica cretica TaxID=69181 RepID=A0A8S9NLN8_BRACR|nr:hypothetical protein F2Q69_00004586 [Brassica cretica]